MKTSHILALLFLLTIASCRKKEQLPVSENADPVFFLDATVNGNKLALQAGNAGYYMHSSFSQDENDIYVFRGDLNSDCQTVCGYSLSVLINDRKVSPHAQKVSIDSAMNIGKYSLLTKDAYPTEQQISFVPKDAFSSNTNYTWTVRDGNGTVTSASSYSFSTNLKLQNTYTVTYRYEDVTGGCSGTHSNVYQIGARFRTWMNTSKNGLDMSLSAFTDEIGEYSYSWDFGDGTSGSGETVKHSYNLASTYLVKLTTTSSDGFSAVCFYDVNTSPNACESNFTAKYSALDYSRVFKTISFILKDDKGHVYSSTDAPIIGTSTAEIISIEDYQTNSNGEATKKLKIRFNCQLRGDNGDVITVENATAVIAVAY
jgi:hypothetical protein